MSTFLAITHVPSPFMDRCVRTFAADRGSPIDMPLAVRQHAAYRAALARAGAEVILLEDNREHPDCVFIEDTAVVVDEVAVMTRMGALPRRGEPAGIEPALAKHRTIARIEAPATLEGGDVLRVGRRIFVGMTERTNTEGLRALEAALRPHGYAVTAVTVRGCLHLKTACTALPDGRILVSPKFLDLTAFDDCETVTVPDDEADTANVAFVGDTVLIGKAYPRTLERLEGLGYRVEALDLSEYAKADGCVTCLSLLFGLG